MTKKEFTDKASKAAGLQYDLWKKFPSYVHMDLTLSTDRQGEDGVKYNIYTPELNHNAYDDFTDFVRFMDKVIMDGVSSVRIQILEDRLRRAQEQRADAIDVIHDAQKELDKIKEEDK